jgi:hypothetical protein
VAERAALGVIGLHAGERARFRESSGGRWHDAVVVGVERDGSVALRDAKRAARSIPLERVEVLRRAGRGRPKWCTAAEVAITWEQLPLW